MAVGSKAWVCSLLIAGIVRLNPAERCSSHVLVACCVGSGLCDEPITPSEEFCRICVCLCVISMPQVGGVGPGWVVTPRETGEGEEFELTVSERILYLRIDQNVGLTSSVAIAVEECGRPGQQNAGGRKMGLKGIFKMKTFDFKLSTNVKSLSQIRGQQING